MQGGGDRVRGLWAVILVALAALLIAACGNEEDVTITRTTDAAAEEEASSEDEIAELEEEVSELQEEADGESSASTVTTTTEAPAGDAGGGASGGVPAGAEPCGAGVYVESSTTSCAFGRNVAADYYSSPGNTFESFSPTTGRSYTMTCSGPPPIVCTGGNDATVYLTDA